MVVYSKSQEYLEREEFAETKSEYYNGEIVAMAGASLPHVRITMDLGTCLNQQLAGKKCEVVGSDMRVFAEECDCYFYPDVVAVCGEPQLTSQRPPSLLNPKAIFEVLSESTEEKDKGTKFACYRAIPTLQDYILIASDKRSIEHYTRVAQDQWMLTIYRNEDAVLKIASINCTLPLKAVYARVEFPAAS